MRIFFITFLFNCGLCACCGALMAQSPSLHALFIGIDEYLDKGYGPTGAKNDTKLLSKFFTERGVPESNIQVLHDEAATRKGILKALENLKSRASVGGVAVFAFSGHGQQIADQVGKGKDEKDGKDEAIVPYDSPKADYARHRLLIDDTLGVLFRAIRQKLGPQGHFLVLIDACFSGTMTKLLSAVPSRGTDEVLCPPNWKPAQTGVMEKTVGVYTEEEGNLGSMMAFFASLPDKAVAPKVLSHDLCKAIDVTNGSIIGPLTIAFYETAISLPVSSPYHAIFRQMDYELIDSGEGHPMYEGNSNQTFCNGILQKVPLVPIKGASLAPLRVYVDPLMDAAYKQRITQIIQEISRYELADRPDNGDLYIDLRDDTLHLLSKTKELYQNNIYRRETMGDLRNNLSNYAQSRALLSLFETTDNSMTASVKIFAYTSASKKYKPVDVNFLDFKAKDSAKLEINYTGKDTAYFSILQMDDKGVVRMFWPFDEVHSRKVAPVHKRKLFPNMSTSIEPIEFTIDSSDRYLIIIITREPINFIPVIVPHIETPKGIERYTPDEKKFDVWLSNMRHSGQADSESLLPSATVIPIQIKRT